MLQVRLAKRNSMKNTGERASSVSNVAVQPTSAVAVDAADLTHMIDVKGTAAGNIAGDLQVEVIRQCLCAVMPTPTHLKKVMLKLNKENTTGLCKEQFVQMIVLCVKKKNKDNKVGETLHVNATTIDAMWVLIQPIQVDGREEISAELLGAWLFFQKIEGIEWCFYWS